MEGKRSEDFNNNRKLLCLGSNINHMNPAADSRHILSLKSLL